MFSQPLIQYTTQLGSHCPEDPLNGPVWPHSQPFDWGVEDIIGLDLLDHMKWGGRGAEFPKAEEEGRDTEPN